MQQNESLMEDDMKGSRVLSPPREEARVKIKNKKEDGLRPFEEMPTSSSACLRALGVQKTL
jgi:hypothetical protein